MSLPDSRNTTYAALTPVRSADLNDLQDWVIAHHDGVHGEIQINLSADGGFGAGWTRLEYGAQSTTDNSTWSIHVPLLVGQRIKAVTCHAMGTNGSNIVACKLVKRNKYGSSVTNKSNEIAGTGTGAGEDIVLTGITPEAAVAGEHWEIYFRTGGGGALVREAYGATVTIDRPA